MEIFDKNIDLVFSSSIHYDNEQVKSLRRRRRRRSLLSIESELYIPFRSS